MQVVEELEVDSEDSLDNFFTEHRNLRILSENQTIQALSSTGSKIVCDPLASSENSTILSSLSSSTASKIVSDPSTPRISSDNSTISCPSVTLTDQTSTNLDKYPALATQRISSDNSTIPTLSNTTTTVQTSTVQTSTSLSENPTSTASSSLVESSVEADLKILLKTVIGQSITNEFLTTKCLSDRCKNELSNLIVRNESDKNGTPEMKISSAKFKEIATAICKIFPGEKECIYYKPYTASISANGKLYTCYQYFIKKYHKKVQAKANRPVYEEATDDIRFLQNNIAPWDKIEKTWVSSFNARQRMEKTNHTINDLIKEYPALMTAYG